MDAVAPEPVLRALLSIHRCCNPIQSNAKKIAASSAIQSHVVGSGFLARQFIRGPADLTPNEWKEAARTASCTRPCGACGRSMPLQEPVTPSIRQTQKSLCSPGLLLRRNLPDPPLRTSLKEGRVCHGRQAITRIGPLNSLARHPPGSVGRGVSSPRGLTQAVSNSKKEWAGSPRRSSDLAGFRGPAQRSPVRKIPTALRVFASADGGWPPVHPPPEAFPSGILPGTGPPR